MPPATNREWGQQPTFSMACQTVAVAATPLNTLPPPSRRQGGQDVSHVGGDPCHLCCIAGGVHLLASGRLDL
jgi:hypothetical protein